MDIAGKPLPQAVTDLSAQTGLQVLYTEALPFQRQAPPVKGNYTAEQALRLMLAGSGLTYHFTSANAVTLEKLPAATEGSLPAAPGAMTLSPVRVQGQNNAPGANPYADPEAPYKADRLSSSKFTEPVLNTPRTETVLTKEVLEDQHATALRDIGRSTAGVTLGSGEGGNAFGDRFFIRGFDVRNDIFVDGIRDPGVLIRDNFDTEQVEILRGPASSFAGRGTTGGAINIVTKEAQDANFQWFDASYGFLDHQKRGTVDVNRVIDDKVDVRLNAMAQGGDFAGRDYTTDNRWGVAVATTLKPIDDVTIKTNYSHTDMWGLPDYGVPYDPVLHRPVTEGVVSRDTYYGIVNRDFTTSIQDVGTVNGQWRASDWLTIENKFRASHSLLNYIGTIPENPSATGPTAPFSSSPTFFSGYVQLNAQSRYEPVDTIDDQPQATFKFETGPVLHTAVVGAEFSSEKVSIDSYGGLTSELVGTDLGPGVPVFASSGAPIVSVFNPVNYLPSVTEKLTGNPLRYKINTNAGYLMDTANYRDFILLNGGIRYDDYSISSANNTSSRSHDDGVPSYNVGLTVKPMPIGSIYAAYATASEPVGDELDATSSSYGGLAPTQPTTQIFGPQKSEAYEVGTKWELFDRHLLATAAAFQTDVTNARETAPAGLPGYTSGQIVAGAAYRVRGLDFEAAGKITDKWSILAGLVIMDPKVTKSIVPTNVGLQLANIAPRSFNLLTKYQVFDWLELGGQAVYDSAIEGGSLLAANGGVAYPNKPNPTILPSYWRFDIFAEAKLDEHTALKLFVQNVFDKTYYESIYQSGQPFIRVAPGRNVLLEATVKF
ncbi:MAG TPA: TonB-dependent receptor [Stellaceae bacterium]|nr:TonB-dependent receptor [Stellaceae bacterium]